jgi:hypothetical protein
MSATQSPRNIADALLAKFFFVRGASYARFSTSFDSGLATSLFQDAAEIAARAAVKAVGAKPGGSFLEYWESVEKRGAAPPRHELPMKGEMEQLNRARAGFKHHGNPPADAAGFERDCYAFLKLVFTEFLGVEFDAVSQADLIADDEMRGHIKAAEQALSEAKLKDALLRCADAMSAARYRRAELGGPGILVRFGGTPEAVIPALRTLEQNMWQHLHHIRDMSIAGILGLKLGEYALIRDWVPDKLGNEYRFPGDVEPTEFDSRTVHNCIRWSTEYCARMSDHIRV